MILKACSSQATCEPLQNILMVKNNSFRFLALISCIIGLGLSGYAQPLTVETRLGDTVTCPRTNLVLPVKVTNMISVDSFLLTLNYDPAALTYTSFLGVNSQLQADTIHISDHSGIITISWRSNTPANIINDKMVELIFRTRTGSSPLTWDTLQPAKCYYLSAGSILPHNFISGSVNLFPAINVTLEQIDPTCTGSCNANYVAYATGGTKPFSYLWNDEHALFDSIQTELCDGPNNIVIKDAKGCVLDSNYVIKGLPATNVVLKVSPDSILYMQNPTLSFSFESKSDVVIKEWLWSFGDGDTSRVLNPVHTYVGVETYQGDSYTLTLKVINEYDCDTLITMNIPVKEAKLTIPNVITPNSDGQNDKFKIVNKEKTDKNSDGGIVDEEYQRLEVVIFDRWGKLKFESNDYHSDWDGGGLPDGAYFFVIKAHGYFRIDKFKGALTILGSNY